MPSKIMSAVALAAILTTPAFAADDEADSKKKGKQARGRQNAAAQIIRQLKDVDLTKDQIAKIKELGVKVAADMKSIRSEAGIDNELIKKRAAVVKAMKDSDKKGKELQAAINKEAGFTEAHAEAMKKVNAARMKFHKDVVAMLTDEQKEKLPARLKRAGGGKKGAAARKANAKKGAKKGDKPASKTDE